MSTGYLFIGIGILSYLLPLFGRQFIIISLLNTVTLGFGGLICIGIGLAVIYLCLRQRKMVPSAGPLNIAPDEEKSL